MEEGHGIDGDSPNTHHMPHWILSFCANKYLHLHHYHCGGSADGGTDRDGGSVPGDNQPGCKRKRNRNDRLDP